tara:strand:+ start:1009 stop:1269 length:261 start_codon:yes stop_codon:yes gene_type:complete
MQKEIELSKSDIDRIIEMAWEDRTTFDAIESQYGLKEQKVKELMRENLKTSSYRLWRKRVYGRKTKHLSKRDFIVGRHKSHDQNKF